MTLTATTFPEGFVWGAGTSAYQIEGAVQEHGRGASIWDVFCRTPGRVRQGHTGELACDHVRRLEGDIALMQEIGLGAYRFSVSWPRVLAHGTGAVNDEGLDFYSRLVDRLLEAGIEPWVTLFHWDLPADLHRRGGWLNDASPEWFEEYAEVVARRLGDRVRHWITINEPQVFIGLGYGTGEHAPGQRLSWGEQVLIAHRVLSAHGRAVRAIRGASARPARIGWAPVGVASSPRTSRPADVEAARRATCAAGGETMFSSTWFNDPVFLGRYPDDGLDAHSAHLPRGWERDLEMIRQPLDFFGMNFYQSTTVEAGPDGEPRVVPEPPGRARTGFGWPVTPEGIYWAARFLFERYRHPIVVTENGLSVQDWVASDGGVHDPLRIDFTARYLVHLRSAIDDGIKVDGYFHWALMDNFEWAEGYEQRFGLIHVDFATQRRVLKDSARWYRAVIESNGGSLAGHRPEIRTSHRSLRGASSGRHANSKEQL